MTNLFSSFDPQVSIFSMFFSLNWISSFIAIIFLPQMFWLTKSQLSMTIIFVTKSLFLELEAIFSKLMIPGTSLIFITFFFFIIFSNFLGLFPFVFTSSSHLVFTLSLSLPLWLGSMIWSMIFQPNNMFAHLVPSGTPPALMPVMVLIETVSSLIRPGTLAIRLAANMVAGHLLLTLLGSQGEANFSMTFFLVMLSLVLLLMLECAVACIQSYVFTILSALYLNELMNSKFSLLNIKYLK